MRETLLVGSGLLVLGFAVFGTHVARGGFYNDDWSFATKVRFQEGSGFVDLVRSFRAFAFRPGQRVYYPLTHTVFGTNARVHLAWAVVTAVVMALLLFRLLVRVGIERVPSAVIAALVLVFGYSSASTFWLAASASHIAIIFFLAGTLLALRGLSTAGRRGIALHAGAVCLYVLGVLTYELVAGAVLVTLLLYRLEAGWSRALRRWVWDAAAIGATLLLVTRSSFYRQQGLGTTARHAWTIAKQGATLVARATVPFGAPNRILVLGALAAVAVAGYLRLRHLPAEAEARTGLTRWLVIMCAGAFAAAAGYVVLVPGEPILSPLSPGAFDRLNVLAAFGIVTFIFSVVMIAAILVSELLGNRAAVRSIVVAAACLTIGAGYVATISHHGAQWDRATAWQGRILATIGDQLQRPEKGSVVYTFGHPIYAAPEIPIFVNQADLSGAMKIRWNDPTISGYAVRPGDGVRCDAGSVAAGEEAPGSKRHVEAPYGKAFFLDVPSRRLERISDATACRAALTRFAPGPLVEDA